MGLLDKLNGLFGSGAAVDDPASEPGPAIDAPYVDHEDPFDNHEAAKSPSMMDADAASAGFPPELR
jgi:hypothetical protein